jgi:hypothetical protein
MSERLQKYISRLPYDYAEDLDELFISVDSLNCFLNVCLVSSQVYYNDTHLEALNIDDDINYLKHLSVTYKKRLFALLCQSFIDEWRNMLLTVLTNEFIENIVNQCSE